LTDNNTVCYQPAGQRTRLASHKKQNCCCCLLLFVVVCLLTTTASGLSDLPRSKAQQLFRVSRFEVIVPSAVPEAGFFFALVQAYFILKNGVKKAHY
jgi:hypothetical protein